MNQTEMQKKVYLNFYGYYEIMNKPLEKELENYYAQKYYQQSKGTYQKQYTKQEIKLITNKLNRKDFVLNNYLTAAQKNKKIEFLDVGSGEGWALDFFSKLYYNVTGVDYSDFGCKCHNPDQIGNMIIGDISKTLIELIENHVTYDIIQLDNVLEHVISPANMLDHLNRLLDAEGILIIEVPNDFSVLHEYLLENSHIDNKFWIAYPDHLSYFNKDGLVNLLKDNNFKLIDLITDFPIDLNLVNEDTNYVKDKSKGKNVHFARVEIENLLSGISLEQTLNMYRILAKMGIGRNIIGFFKKE